MSNNVDVGRAGIGSARFTAGIRINAQLVTFVARQVVYKVIGIVTDELVNCNRDVIINNKCRRTASADVEIKTDKQAVTWFNNAI